MLRTTLRQCSSRLVTGSTAARTRFSTSSTALASKRRALAIAAQRVQKRHYAISAEDTSKGVVSLPAPPRFSDGARLQG